MDAATVTTLAPGMCAGPVEDMVNCYAYMGPIRPLDYVIIGGMFILGMSLMWVIHRKG